MKHPRTAAARKQAQIDRINEISQLARTAWFSLIAYLLFVGITLLGVEDADFFVPTRQTQLPLVNVQIPTQSFFYAAPILAAALYTYLHLFLIKLWEAHGQARTRDADPTHHWLVNDYALIRQGDPAARARPLAWLVPVITLLLVWLAGPIVLGYAWWRSMPAHNEWMTLLIAACFWLTLVVGLTSWSTARARLHETHRTGRRNERAAALCALVLVFVSWVRTEGGLDRYFSAFSNVGGYPATDLLLAPTDLSGAALGREPADWREHDYARGRYRENWCERHLVPADACQYIGSLASPNRGEADAAHTAACQQGDIDREACASNLAEFETSFAAEWQRERQAYLAQLDTPNQAGSDLRRADLRNAFLADADLREARLEGADLREARLEGSRLQGADLRWGRLEGADLRNAFLANADLREARLEGADLREARLEGTDLSYADFRGSNWAGASNRASPAQFADFRGAQGLIQAQLDQMIGNEDTLLPEGLSDGGAPWYLWSCWVTAPPDLNRIVAIAAGALASAAERAALRAEFLCGPDNPRRRTGTPLALDAPYPEGHPLADRD